MNPLLRLKTFSGLSARVFGAPVVAFLTAALAGTLVSVGHAADPGTVTPLHQFSGPALYAGLIKGTDGNFYGTTGGGGAFGYGSVFKLTSAGVLTTLHSFTYTDGYQPQAALVQANDGDFYGTTHLGGANNGGVAFKVTPAGVYTLLHNFDEAGGYHPESAMIQGTDGNLYGTASEGGTVMEDPEGYGAIYRITPAGVFTTLHSLIFEEGEEPVGSLVQGTDGNFYGTCEFGGSEGAGTVFKMNTAGTVTVLRNLLGSTDGSQPVAGLIQGADGNFYGTTPVTGPNDNAAGTIFRITSGGGFTVLHTFTYGDGSSPSAPLVKGADGNFYGTTSGGGSGSYGTVFRVTTGGTVTTLHPFTFPGTYEPNAPLCLGDDGNFYGTTFMGNVIYHGEIFRVSPGGTFADFYTFPRTNGATSYAGLIQGKDGDFYGTTYYGGDYGDGSVFKMSSAGVLSTLHSFNGTDGDEPTDNLILGSDGNFYGTTQAGGGPDNLGTVFRISSSGTFTLLHPFAYSDGYFPQAALVQGTDGNFYGTTSAGGANEYGTVFRVTSAGALTVLHNFTNTDGSNAQAALIEGAAGTFYGTTLYGGTTSNSYGTVFKVTSAGALTTLHSFNGTDGQYPHAPLIKGADGNFYGTTESGGANGYGSVYRITTGGTATTLHSFNFDDGYSPGAALLLANDGYFYGTTSEGGENDAGVIFRVGPAGGTSFALLHSFGGIEGSAPDGALIQANDGLFYGTNSTIGATGATDGTVFRFSLLPELTSAKTATAVLNQAFSYQTKATNDPTKFAATGLPAGLSINATTGQITGTPTAAGTFAVKLSLTNAFGTSTATLTLTVTEPAPVITSAKSPFCEVGVAFSYQITASNNPTSFGATGLPPGLSVNTATGLITGTPTQAGAASTIIKATNSGGTGARTLALTVRAQSAPVITSASTANGKVGTALGFRITASNGPTSFAAANLPPGLAVNTTSGLISGTPTKAGKFAVTVSASNPAGKGSATLTMTIAD